MVKIFSMVPSIAATDSSVLITGETGTGKDVLAEAIHNASDRAGAPFIKVNCGALPETLLESELFGHVKGAYTGANEDRPGRIKLAHNGSFFLTEIGDLPLPLQVKLLSFLDDKVIHRWAALVALMLMYGNCRHPPGPEKMVHENLPRRPALQAECGPSASAASPGTRR